MRPYASLMCAQKEAQNENSHWRTNEEVRPQDLHVVFPQVFRHENQGRSAAMFEGSFVLRILRQIGGRNPQNLKISLCDIVGLLQESKRPLPQKLRKKSEKGFPGPLGPGFEKPRKGVENDYFSSFFRVFGPFSTFFSTFFELLRPRGLSAPGTPFRTFFRSFLGRGLLDSCRRPTMSQVSLHSRQRSKKKSSGQPLLSVK